MKNILAFFLVASILVASFKNLALYSYLQWNKDFIAQNYCINIKKPELLCSGKCYIAKELQKDQTQQERLPSKKQDFNSNFLLAEVPDLHKITIPTFTKKSTCTSNQGLLGIHWVLELLRPPDNMV